MSKEKEKNRMRQSPNAPKEFAERQKALLDTEISKHKDEEKNIRLEMEKKWRNILEHKMSKEQEKNRMRQSPNASNAPNEFAERQKGILAAEISKHKDEEKTGQKRKQLRRDKIEKNKRFEMEKKLRKEALAEIKKFEASHVFKADNNSTLIQFLLPDGSSLSNQFPADATFLCLYDFICKHTEANQRLTTLIEYEFTAADMEKSLRELSLVPKASITISPGKPKIVATPRSLFISIINFIYYPLLLLYHWVLSFFPTKAPHQPQNGFQNNEVNKSNSTHYKRLFLIFSYVIVFIYCFYLNLLS